MKNPIRRHHSAFSLIELMATITIIVILAGVIFGGMSYVNEKQAREKAKVQIALLSKAIEEFKSDMGRYPGTADPSPGDGNISQQLYIELFYEGYDYSTRNNPSTWEKEVTVGTTKIKAGKATKIYLPELDPRNTKMGWLDTVTTPTPPATAPIKDPWGNNYRYRKGTSAQNPDFDLYSWGKDGRNNSTPNHADNKDDIRNF